MESVMLKIDPYSKQLDEIHLTDEIVAAYSLEPWAENFSLMTAGYRDQLNPDDINDPEVKFNSLIVAILGEAKARVFSRKAGDGNPSHVMVGGEVRPHTQEFIAILSRIYAAYNITVHLRKNTTTTPIWYSSFGVFYSQYQSGDNMTASHSPYFKGGWKPMDGSGKQLVAEEKDVIAEVRNIVFNRETIKLAPWEDSDLIIRDFDVDDAYINYQDTVITDKDRREIETAIKNGFRCTACTVGGSMKATTERLLPRMGFPTGPDGIVHYIFGDENSRYHGLGELNGEHFGPDPSKSQVYKNIGAQKILLNGESNIIVLWDPDGDRFNIVTTTPSENARRAKELGLEVEPADGSDKAIVYFTPNQLFFMITAFRINSLKETGMLDKFDWFVTLSLATSRSIEEIAATAGIPSARVRVGFKHIGTFSEWLENRKDPNEPFIDAIGDKVIIGDNPRSLIMCEESGGSVYGGTEFLRNKSHSKGMIALREKDGMQFGLMALCLATELYNRNLSFAEYYCDLISTHKITNKFYNRRDVRLYDESLHGDERALAESEGFELRDKIMGYFMNLAQEAASGKSMEDIQSDMNSRLSESPVELPCPVRVDVIGEGNLLEGMIMEFEKFWFVLRASGTDALLRYYIEGTDKSEISSYQDTLVNLKI
jgi:phosphomannomutase